MSRIQKNAAAGQGTAYSEHLRSKESCLPLLEKALPEYRAMKTNEATPPEYAPMLDELVGNLEEIQKAWSDFADYQTGASKRDRMRESIEKRGSAWAGYQGGVEDGDEERKLQYQASAITYTRFMSCLFVDPGYTSYESVEGGDTAQDQASAAIDERCRADYAALAKLVETKCASHLTPTEPPEPDAAFKAITAHWVAEDSDFGVGSAVLECLTNSETKRTKELSEAIARSWYGYGRSYSKIFDHSRGQTKNIFDRGRTGQEGAAEPPAEEAAGEGS